MTGPAPTPPQQRIEILDILRGFALFGVLLMNMQYFVEPPYQMILRSQSATLADWLGFWAVRLLAESKFYPLFSFLFGYGMAIQMRNAAQRGERFVPLFAWRMAILMLIGAYHAVYLWSGDILGTYALLALALLPLRNAPVRTLLIASVVILFAASAILALFLSGALPDSIGDASIARWLELGDEDRRGVRQALRVMSMFVLGLCGGRLEWIGDDGRHGAVVRALCGWGLALGIAGNLAYVWLREIVAPSQIGWKWVAAISMLAWSGPLLAAAYAAWVLRLARVPRMRRWLAPLAAVGRMALTNYLLQTIVCQPLMGESGLGRSGGVHPPVGVLMTFVVFLVQVGWSVVWLRVFRFGPMEWLWRSLTYGRLQPMRR